jgi:hypothetical protein
MSELELYGGVAGIAYFPGGKMAALLERSLFDAPEEASVGRLLDASAEALSKKLNDAIDDLEARRFGHSRRRARLTTSLRNRRLL